MKPPSDPTDCNASSRDCKSKSEALWRSATGCQPRTPRACVWAQLGGILLRGRRRRRPARASCALTSLHAERQAEALPPQVRRQRSCGQAAPRGLPAGHARCLPLLWVRNTFRLAHNRLRSDGKRDAASQKTGRYFDEHGARCSCAPHMLQAKWCVGWTQSGALRNFNPSSESLR